MKRTKLIASLMMCVFCLSFLVVGVWATVTSVNFNLNGNLQFSPEGVFVEISGQVYRGDSTTTLEALTSDPRFTLDKQTNFDNSSGEPSGNFPMQSWEIDNLTFTPVDRYIEVRVTIKNHSSFIITATPTVLLNSLDTASNTFTNFTVTDNRSEVEAINSGATKTYTLLIELNKNATAFTDNTLSISFTFDEAPIEAYLTWVNDDVNTTTANDGYWTLPMGEYEGTPLIWRMVLKETEASDGTTDVESVEGYTQDTPLSGSYYFLLDTYIADVFASRVGSIYYYLSTMRGFLINSGTSNFVSKFNLENSIVYKNINARTLTDLYSNMGDSTNKTPVDFNYGVDPDSIEDKLWVLSYYEYSKIGSGGVRWSASYCLRTEHYGSNYLYFWDKNYATSGSLNYGASYNSTYPVRPAFKITIN